MSNSVATQSQPGGAPPDTATASVGTTVAPALTQKQERFAQAFVETGNMSLAYRHAYEVGVNTKPKTIWDEAQRVFALPQVQARVAILQEAAAATFISSKVQLAAFLWKRITADRAQVVRQVVRCCRHCYGQGHKYQWKDQAEYADAMVRALERQQPMPTDDGGYGFDPHLPPAATCDVAPCMGEGTVSTVITDTLTLQGGAAAIYEGVDRFGMPVLADRAKDIELFMKVTGISSGDLEGMLRGAAAGGAAGAVAAQAVVEKVKTMSADDTRRAYLTMIGGG